MSLRRIARKDYRDALRDRSLYLTAGLFGLLGLALGYFFSRNVDSTTTASEATNGLTVALSVILGFVIPIFALGLSQSSIVSKRMQGELKVLLGLPFSRASIVFGTFLGRAGVTLSAQAAVTLSTLVTVLAFGVALEPLEYLAVMALVGVLGLTFVGIAVGISAAVSDTTRSALGAFGVFLLFVFRVWDLFPNGVAYLLNGFSSPRTSPEWVTAFGNLDPLTAFGNVVAELYPDLRGSMATFGVGGSRGGLEPALYQEAWFGAAVLVAWILVPLLVGYRRFARTDL
jgi:ABC-2 type transport system permease protein